MASSIRARERPRGKRASRPAPAPAADAGVVRVTTRGGPFAGVSAAVVRRRAEKMLQHLGLGSAELSIALVDDRTIQALNRAYRRKDKPTDVLAFPLLTPGAQRHAGRSRPKAPLVGLLGDVILSIETARRQARSHRRPLLGELTMLLAHGLLHLLGYDHHTDAEELEMTARTRDLEAAAIVRRTDISPLDAPSRRRTPSLAHRRSPER
jgi:probable rRNA maturation factor